MGLIDRITGGPFRRDVEAKSVNGLSEKEIASLHSSYRSLGLFAKLSVASYLRERHPALFNALQTRPEHAVDMFEGCGGRIER